MRRLFLSALVAGGLAFLAACSGQGGYGFNSGSTTNPSVDRIVFSNGSGGVQGFWGLYPGTGGTLQINATGVKGSQNVAVPDATFTWSAAFTGAPTQYSSGVNGVTKNCPTAPTNTPAIPLYTGNVVTSNNTGGATAPNIPYDGRYTTTVFVGQPTVGPNPPYCLIVTATAANGIQGSVVVIVSQTP